MQYYIKTTLSHLVQKYGYDIAEEIMSKNMNSLFDYHGLAWQLGRESFDYFCRIFLRYPLFTYDGDNIPLSPTHYKIWGDLENKIIHKNESYDVYIFPRSFAKTNAIGIPCAMWTSFYGICPYVVIQSDVEKRAIQFVNNIRIYIERNPVINQAFGELRNKSLVDNRTELELDIGDGKVKIEAYSAGSSLRGCSYGGKRISLLIEDDGQKFEDVQTNEGCEKVVELFYTDAVPALQGNNSHVIALGTVIHPGDLYDTLRHSETWGVHTEKLVQLDDVDDYFNNDPGWREVRKILRTSETNPRAADDAYNYYLDNQKEMDFPLLWNKWDCYNVFLSWLRHPIAFRREFQNDIEARGERRIYALKTESEKEIESLHFVKTILSVDPASTATKKSDYSAFCVLGEAENGCRYARKMRLDKFDDYRDIVQVIIDLLLIYTDICLVEIEKQTYNGADAILLRERIAEIPELRNREIQICNEARTKNKEKRIDTFAVPDINTFKIIFNEDDYREIEQIKDFRGCNNTEHDDMIDCCSSALERVAKTINTKRHYFHTHPLYH